MLEFIKRHRQGLITIIILLGAIQLLSLGLRGEGILSLPSRAILTLSYYPLKAISSGINAVQDLGKHYLFLVNLSKENEALKRELDQLRFEKNQLIEVALENDRLRALLDFKRSLGGPAIPAEVVGEDTSSWFRTILINKGSEDKVARGMGVVTKEGIVGQVSKVSARLSQVLLIVDPSSNVDTLIRRNRAKGILTGKTERVCQLKYLSRLEEIKIGDEVVTSGIGGIFPKGLEVGVVNSVEKKSYGMFQNVLVTPKVDFGKLEEVLVLSQTGAIDWP
ncbi:MAG: rod shape-determining protein MreC [Deltaproteobacteria bacterium]|nr:MAG: rod shape-determining protein MreC [Deltaproteobacteria bacterium]